MTQPIPAKPADGAAWPTWGTAIDGAARVSMKWCGTWATGVVYSLNDLVVAGGVMFVCVAAHTSSGSAPTVDTAQWKALGITAAERAKLAGLAAGGQSVIVMTDAEYAAATKVAGQPYVTYTAGA